MVLSSLLTLKRSLCKPCHSEKPEVHDPKGSPNHHFRQQRNLQRSSSSSSSKEEQRKINRNSKKSSSSENCSPRSKGNSNNNIVTHEVVLDPTSGQVRFCPCCPFPQYVSSHHHNKGIFEGSNSKSSKGPNNNNNNIATPSRQTHHHDVDACSECNISRPSTPPSSSRVFLNNTKYSNDDPSNLMNCEKCGQKLKNLDAIEAHSVTELDNEDSSRKIIERICQTSSIMPNNNNKPWQIESVLKVQHMHKSFSSFEEHRELTKMNALKLQQQHQTSTNSNNNPRCLADGNELLRFHGTTISCSLGLNNNNNNNNNNNSIHHSSSSSSLCNSGHCGICQILRHGFSTKMEEFHGEMGVLTNSTSAKALESIMGIVDGTTSTSSSVRKCVVVCRVIAGRVKRFCGEEEEIQEIMEEDDNGDDDDSGLFDSLAGKMCCLEVEELYVLNPKALLPCFVVIYS